MKKALDLLLSGGIFGAPKWGILFLLSALSFGLAGYVWQGLYIGIVLAFISAVYSLYQEE